MGSGGEEGADALEETAEEGVVVPADAPVRVLPVGLVVPPPPLVVRVAEPTGPEPPELFSDWGGRLPSRPGETGGEEESSHPVSSRQASRSEQRYRLIAPPGLVIYGLYCIRLTG